MGYEFRGSASPLIRQVWRAVAEADGEYTDAANEFWGLAFDQLSGGGIRALLIGPSTEPRTMVIRAGDTGWGVEFPAHVLLRRVPKLSLLGEMRELPCEGGFFDLAGVRFPVTEYEEMERLVEALATQGVLTYDVDVARALDGEHVAYSQRQLRRRASDATGLGPNKLAQLRRSREAYRLLQQGMSLVDAALAVGYSDQAHLTRSFRLIAGQSPARLLADDANPFESRR